jgi:hypothetical protein
MNLIALPGGQIKDHHPSAGNEIGVLLLIRADGRRVVPSLAIVVGYRLLRLEVGPLANDPRIEVARDEHPPGRSEKWPGHALQYFHSPGG